jgi:NAD(P)-dependent dehydrogenase (short-subunit alcohol dehydrogenase family)
VLVSGRLDGRVVVITGAGRGLGAEHARLLAAMGARVVVNDYGSAADGSGADQTPAQALVEEIRAAGGEAVVDTEDVADFEGAKRLIDRAVSTFGDLDVLINNAGILRDRMLVNMTPEEWDDIMRVHLRGHFCPTRHAAAYWRQRTRESGARDAVLIHTSSTSGIVGSVGQTNYGTAKSGLATLALLCHAELNERYAVRCYAVAPGARTRLTLQTPGAQDIVAAPADESQFDFWHPGNVSPLYAWLAAADCPAPSGSVYNVQGDEVLRFATWSVASTVRNGGQRWTLESLDAAAADLAGEAVRA